MAKRKKATPPPAPEAPPEENLRQHLWHNGWGITMASLTLAPLRPDGTEPEAEGLRVWFEGPRHGWVFPHIELLGNREFVCRASDVENDFLGDLVTALLGILNGTEPTRADAFGEPQSFSFRFSRTDSGAIRLDIVTFNRFREPIVEEPVFGITASGDVVCREFCFGFRVLYQTMAAEDAAWGYSFPFPTEGLTVLCSTLGGEFANGLGGTGPGGSPSGGQPT